MGIFCLSGVLQRWPESGALSEQGGYVPGAAHEREAHRAGGTAPGVAREQHGDATPGQYLQRAGTPEVGRDAVFVRRSGGSYQAGSKPSSDARASRDGQLAATRDRTPREAPRRQRLI
jgi:hypothetical protein